MTFSFWQSLIRCKNILLKPSTRRSSIRLRPDIAVQYHSDLCYAPALIAAHGSKVTLDAYQLASISAKGTVIFLHGGGLRRGSKRHILGKDLYFNHLGYNFLSCNYPLSAEGGGSVIDDQLLALRSLDQWVNSDLPVLCPVNPSAPVIYLGHSAGSYLLALGLSKGLFSKPHTSFIFVDSAAYDLSKRYRAARQNVRLEIERLVGHDANTNASLNELISKYSPVECLLNSAALAPSDDKGWAYFATTQKRFSHDSSLILASLLKTKLNMQTTVKAYPFSHTDISQEISDPNSEIGRDLAQLLSN